MAYLTVGLIAIAFLAVTALANESNPRRNFNDEDSGFKPIKRQAVYNVPSAATGQPVYAPQQEVPPEFLNYLQQLSEQQAAALPQAPPQPPQHQPQQHLTARGPPQQIFQPQPQPAFQAYRVAAAPPPSVPRLSPQAEEQRRLQQEYADRPLREQQQRALQQLFQPAPAPAFRSLPVYAPQPQLQSQPQPHIPQPQIPQPAQYSPEELRALAEQQYIAYEQAQFVEQPVAVPQAQRQHQPQPQPQQHHQPQIQTPLPKYYSQIQFGSQPTSSHKVRSQPQPQQTQTLFYSQQPDYYQSQQQTPTHPQLPEQYLIETSKPQQQDEQRIVSIPRPKQQSHHHQQQQQTVYYRQQQQQQQTSAPKYAEDNLIRSTTAAPSRSSIYVSKSGQDSKPVYTLGETLQQTFSGSNQIRLPDTRGSSAHPLSQTELSSLLQAGFQVSTPPDSRRNLLSGPSYLRSVAGKRHNKRVPSPVPLSDDERRALAQQGIRNLYKVESSESQNSPVTYVLALDNNLKQRNGHGAPIIHRTS